MAFSGVSLGSDFLYKGNPAFLNAFLNRNSLVQYQAWKTVYSPVCKSSKQIRNDNCWIGSRSIQKKYGPNCSEYSNESWNIRKTYVAKCTESEGQHETALLSQPEPPNPFGKFFDNARAVLNRFQADEVGRDVLALAFPAALMGISDPMVQLTETAIVSRMGEQKHKRLRCIDLDGSLKWGSSNVFDGDDLGIEMAAIALPALLALAADPIASLTDTYFIAQIGPVELAAVGVSVSIFNLVSKIFNFPLLNITTSFVAEDEEAAEAQRKALGKEGKATKPVLPSVSSALVLGTALGLIEAAFLIFGAGSVLDIMGVPVNSAMRGPATDYLALRAIGAPAVVVALASQGVFRGFKDTKTPLYSTVGANLVNVVLDPILMFSCGFGVGGAAVATVISQYAMAGALLWSLDKRVTLIPPRLEDLKLERFLKSAIHGVVSTIITKYKPALDSLLEESLGGLLLGRTLALLSTMTLATSMAARQGSTPMAAHQVCMQIWLAASLLSDSVALAGQTMLASAFAKGDMQRAKAVMYRILQVGLAMGVLMALLLSLGASSIPRVFSKDEGVLDVMDVIFPFVAATQPITSLAFVFDGIHYGASDFGYAATAMILLVIPIVGVLLVAPNFFGLGGVWMGLTLLMSARMFTGFYRVGTASGPWRILRTKSPQELE